MRIPCLTLVFVTFYCYVACNPVATNNKAQIRKKPNPERQPALIAIEIVNSTNSKNNTKRTIESSLSYGGYNGNNFYYKTQDGKFEIYPYSQHDIPPLNDHNDNVRIQPAYSYTVGKPGHHRFHHSQAHPTHQSYQSHHQQQHPQYHYQQQHQQTEQLPYSQQNFHKTSAYSQPTYTSHQATAQPVVYPTLFFTTLDQSGQIGDVTEHLPQNYNKQQQQLVPVIILRVPSDQLITSHDTNAAYTPTNYASQINPLHVQALLASYLQQHTYQVTPTNTEQEVVNHQHVQEHEPNPNYTIQENYPSVAHTRIVYNTKPVKNTADTAAYYYAKSTTAHPQYYQASATQTEQPQQYKAYKTSAAHSPASSGKEPVSNHYLPTATHDASKYKSAAAPENEYVYYYSRSNNPVNYVTTLPQGYVYENANSEQIPQGYDAANNEQTQYILVHPDQAAGAYPIDMAALYYQTAYPQSEQEDHQAFMTNVEQPPPAPRQGSNTHRSQHSDNQDHAAKVYNYHANEYKNKRSDKKTKKNGEVIPTRVRSNKRD